MESSLLCRTGTPQAMMLRRPCIDLVWSRRCKLPLLQCLAEGNVLGRRRCWGDGLCRQATAHRLKETFLYVRCCKHIPTTALEDPFGLEATKGTFLWLNNQLLVLVERFGDDVLLGICFMMLRPQRVGFITLTNRLRSEYGRTSGTGWLDIVLCSPWTVVSLP